jgi:hypothetical protein
MQLRADPKRETRKTTLGMAWVFGKGRGNSPRKTSLLIFRFNFSMVVPKALSNPLNGEKDGSGKIAPHLLQVKGRGYFVLA